MRGKVFVRLAVLLVCLAAIASRGLAATFNWNNSAGGLWALPSSWSPVTGPPSTGDIAHFDLAGSYTVSISTGAGNRADTVEVSAASVTTLQSASTSAPGKTVTLLDSNDAVLDSSALMTLHDNALNPGTVNAANGLTLNFGGNISGFGTVNTPDDPFRPFINNGHIQGISAAKPVTLPGFVKGVGTLDNVTITGTSAPGFSPATVYFGSVNYAGTLEIELAGTAPGQFDVIHHSGVATLGGVLDVSLLNGFTPTVGDMFEIMTAAGGVSGQFATLSSPTMPGGKRFSIVYGPTNVVLAVLPALEADFDEDGDLDGNDLNQWRGDFGANGLSDADDDGDSDGGDFLTWQRQVGSGVSAIGATAAVPEPSIAGISAPFVTAMCRRKAARAR